MGVNLSPRRCGGFLTKRGGRVKTWRRRWFIFDLDHQRLAYYTGEEKRRYYNHASINTVFQRGFKANNYSIPTLK